MTWDYQEIEIDQWYNETLLRQEVGMYKKNTKKSQYILCEEYILCNRDIVRDIVRVEGHNKYIENTTCVRVTDKES